ncbi:MAG: hypothetical protein AAFY46_15265, partial [Planctomycetota bacterium]
MLVAMSILGLRCHKAQRPDAVGVFHHSLTRPNSDRDYMLVMLTPSTQRIDERRDRPTKFPGSEPGCVNRCQYITSDDNTRSDAREKLKKVAETSVPTSVKNLYAYHKIGLGLFGVLFALLVAHTVFAGQVHAYTTKMAAQLFAPDA